MSYVPDNPLVVQSDQTLLLETGSPKFEEARDALLGFAELVKSPEYVHTWRITPLTLWNAAAAGHSADDVVAVLASYAKYPVPEVVPQVVRLQMDRYGRLRLVRDGRWLRLEADDRLDLEEVRHISQVGDLFSDVKDGGALRIHPRRRGELKQVLASLGHPVRDLAGYEDGDALEMALSRTWSLRDYQVAAIDAFHAGPGAGSGVIVLPCGAGKTVVGVAAMVRLGMRTLVLCTGNTAVQQWRREILARTTLTEDQVGEFGAERKELRPVTLTTYQMLAWRRSKAHAPAHFDLFHRANWGLVIYDEVHLLPAPIFRETASLQARRRLGLTATLVREDGRETDVFALVGPKLFDVPWKVLEHQGWIATARCVEVRVPFSDTDRLRYLSASPRAKTRIASTNARKGPVVEAILERHAGEQILVLGTDLDQLGWLARKLEIPLVTGETPASEREERFDAFRRGELAVLALSKVGNFAIDLPGASVAVQVSGTFGSRQEEAQRLGRILRPHPDGRPAAFYTLVTSDSDEEDYAHRRQLFLTEQGYPYRIRARGVTSELRAVSLVEVADPSVWTELAAVTPLDGHTEGVVSPTCRVATRSFHEVVLPALAAAGVPVLVRDARRTAQTVEVARHAREEVVAHLSRAALAVLHQAQRHGVDAGLPAWDPETDAALVRELLGAELLVRDDDGRYALASDLPPPPALLIDVGDALMPPTDDLPAGRPGPVALLHDLASLAAAIDHTTPSRTHAGTVARADVRRMAVRLATEELRKGGSLESDVRWGRALRALEALGVVSHDPIDRTLHLDLGLDHTLSGDTEDAVDRFVRRLVDADLRPAVPVVRETLRVAGEQAVDELVWMELLRDQHRSLLFVPWHRDGRGVYPGSDVPFDDEAFERIESGLLHRLLERLEMLGVIRRAPGVFAATADGRRWAGAAALPPPPVWVSSDLQVIVPPDGVTPWERFQLERLGRCLRRDVVDVYVLERAGLTAWLRWHDLDEALALLARRAPAVPAAVVEALSTWARQAMRVVVTRGVLV